jgi:CDP-glucose 4,6-dehydratase
MVEKSSTLANLGMTSFWCDSSVLITGHTGFKGSWLALWLAKLGANVTGFALEPNTPFFASLGLEANVRHIVGDIRDATAVRKVIKKAAPDFVFHLAAQSLVLTSYDHPIETWNTNVMGSLNVLEAMREQRVPPIGLMITTDKVYENAETGTAFNETSPLGGNDPYSASKAAMEIATSSWRKSFMADNGIKVATARAGNVIGGGDWAENRIVPDIVRALSSGAPINVRNPMAIRPWQHVLDPLSGYMRLAKALFESNDAELQSAFNFGPTQDGMRTVSDLVKTALEVWPGDWISAVNQDAQHEAATLTLNAEKSRRLLGQESQWGFERSVRETITWYKLVAEGSPPRDTALSQIEAFEST